MTKYVIFDVETTGMSKRDEVIQFSAIVVPDKVHTVCCPEKMVNFYCETQVPISAGAFNVHQLSRQKLHVLSEGMVFEDNWLNFVDSLREHQVVWVDWSVGAFDERLINQTLTNNGLPDYFHFPRFRDLNKCLEHRFSCLDLMGIVGSRFGKSSMKLVDAVNSLPYTRERINNAYLANATRLPNFDETMKFHNALYDSYVTRLVLKYYMSI